MRFSASCVFANVLCVVYQRVFFARLRATLLQVALAIEPRSGAPTGKLRQLVSQVLGFIFSSSWSLFKSYRTCVRAFVLYNVEAEPQIAQVR